MREIKFRAWHKGSSGGRNPDYAHHMLYDEKPGDCLIYVNQGQNIDSVVQFTGLKDKNGKEIYEGDVLKCDDSNEDHEEFITKVVFDQGQFRTDYYGFPVYSWAGKNENCWCEVIGNIYENPELLK